MRRVSPFLASLCVLGAHLSAGGAPGDWLYNGAFANWITSNAHNRYHTFTPESADRRAAEFAAAGFKAVITSGYHFRLNYAARDADIRRIARLIADACHKHGLKVIEHHDWTIHFYDGYRNALQLNVGAPQVKGYTNLAADDSVRIERDERFAQTAPVRVEGASPRDPKAGAAFQVPVPRDGRYMLNLLVGAPDRPIGPCALWTDETKKRQTPRVAAGDYDTWTVVGHAVSGQITVRLSGDFRLAAMGVAPMLYDTEDYLFRRGWWLSPQRHPDDSLPD